MEFQFFIGGHVQQSLGRIAEGQGCQIIHRIARKKPRIGRRSHETGRTTMHRHISGQEEGHIGGRTAVRLYIRHLIHQDFGIPSGDAYCCGRRIASSAYLCTRKSQRNRINGCQERQRSNLRSAYRRGSDHLLLLIRIKKIRGIPVFSFPSIRKLLLSAAHELGNTTDILQRVIVCVIKGKRFLLIENDGGLFFRRNHAAAHRKTGNRNKAGKNGLE